MDRFQLQFLRSLMAATDSKDLTWSPSHYWADEPWLASHYRTDGGTPSSRDWWIAQPRLARGRCPTLDQAASFVLAPCLGKLHARAFELLRSRPSLIHHLVSTSGMNEAEAKAAIRKAEWFVRENYFIISKVVRSKLECNAGSGTQIDQLSTECLIAITKYLKVDDIHP